MKDKDTQNFERESFKDKILRELEASKQVSDEEVDGGDHVNDSLRPTENATDENNIADITLNESDLIHNKSQSTTDMDKLSEDASVEEQKPKLEKKAEMSRKPRESQENLKRSAKKASKRLAGKIIAVVALILFVAGGATAYFGYRYLKSELQPYSTTDKTIKAIN
ncbi:MAG: hypothetical protein L0I13_06125, partial [Lactococcus plantarum]|nr:hypothetical protein [Lactococcus plantarum]